jgi:hypothetical protein
MIDLGSFRRWLIIVCLLGGGCNSSSPLVWSAADDLDEDGDENAQVEEEPPPPPPPPPDNDDSGIAVGGMDSGIVVVEPDKPPCGTGPGCDPTDLGGETCESLGAGSGRLLCDSTTCLFELGLCDGLPRDASVGRPCGTGPGCEPDDLGGETCTSLGMQSGVLACDPETCQYDTSMCGPGGGTGGAGSVFGGGMGGDSSGGGGMSAGGSGGGFFGGGNGGGAGSFFGGNFFGGNQDAGADDDE